MVAIGGMVVGTADGHGGEEGGEFLGSVIDEVCLGFVAAGDVVAAIAPVRVGIEELLEKHAAYSMHRCSDGHLRSFEVHPAAAIQGIEEEGGQDVYFPGELLRDRFDEVFFSASAAEDASCSSGGIGRNSQISSLTSIILLLSSRKRW